MERWKQVLSSGEGPDPKWVELLQGVDQGTGSSEGRGRVRPSGQPRVREYELVGRSQTYEDRLQADGAEMIAVSDGSMRYGAAAFAMLPVQNLDKVCASRVVGVQGIAKAELLGAWAQLKAAEPTLRANKESEFVGFLDNESMVKTLQKAQTLTHRDIHRAKQGNLYLRETKALMGEFQGRARWAWIKAHTHGKGWFYERHNKCDLVAGVVTEEADIPQSRFMEWDWDCILVDEEQQRVEGDVRRAVKRRVAEQEWSKGAGGHTMGQWAGVSPAQERLLKTTFLDRSQLAAQREILAAMGERWS